MLYFTCPPSAAISVRVPTTYAKTLCPGNVRCSRYLTSNLVSPRTIIPSTLASELQRPNSIQPSYSPPKSNTISPVSVDADYAVESV